MENLKTYYSKWGLMTQVLVIFMLLFSTFSHAKAPIRLAVATNFKQTLIEIVQAFEAQNSHTHPFTVSAAASGVLANQIKRGAPFHIFFSADVEKVSWLTQQKIGSDAGTYAVGQLALLSHSPLSHDVKTHLQALSLTQKKLALANPKLAPYGLAAKEVMQKLGLAEALKTNIIKANNVSQVAQFIETGSVNAGFVSSSQLRAGDNYLIIDSILHSEIRQNYLLVGNFKNKEQEQWATRFISFVLEGRGAEIIAKNGYALLKVDG